MGSWKRWKGVITMDKVWVVRKGKHFNGLLRAVYCGMDYMDCEDWIKEHIKSGDHMYIEQCERLNRRDQNDILKYAKTIKWEG